MKRIFAVNDMSGIGKCSLTAAIPIISAAGMECNPIPTAVLSTHTGNIEGYTFRDLTDDIIPYIRHWEKIGVKPDTIYSGYLGSKKQIDSVIEIIKTFKSDNTLVIVDPAMADSGEMYKGFDTSFADDMRKLCELADVITPNITEAAFLTGQSYRENYDKEYTDLLLDSIKELTSGYAVITGISDIPGKTGCLVYDIKSDVKKYFSTPKCGGIYYGTGDIFTSVLAAMMTKGKTCFESAEIALDFTYKSILETFNEGTDPRLGVAFEKYLYLLSKEGQK